jgi:hypothetical protein
MQFIHDGVFHKIARTTGPSHNLLGLDFGREGQGEPPTVVVLRTDAPPYLNGDAVVREVMAGINDANQAFGTHFRVAAIQYSQDDTPPESTYRQLAFSLVERLAKNLPFVGVPRQPSA